MTLKMTEEEKKAHQRELGRLRVERYRARHGDKSLGRGQTHKGEKITTIEKGGALIHIKEAAQAWRPEIKTRLTRDSKLEDLLPWAMEVAEELRSNPTPAAWASALNSVLKIIEYLDKKLPPKMPEVKPRPRQVIVIEDETKETEE